MNAIMVSVNYADLLAITLPYNRHHFDRVLVVTDSKDVETARIAGTNRAEVFVTDSFYAGGAVFNKWAALEEGLDVLGRRGWLCVMDADVLWPKSVCLERMLEGESSRPTIKIGQLSTPMRRMWDSWPMVPQQWAVRDKEIVPGWVPPEDRWYKFPLHRQQREFAGYSQIFHADDLHLGPAPWHQTDWIHAGGADSFFQMKWPDDCKVRPPFEVLHLGRAGSNWFGRATALADGTVPEGAAVKRSWSERRIWEQRRANRAAGRDQFEGERLGRG